MTEPVNSDSSQDKTLSRRELLRSVLRVASFGALTAGGYKLATSEADPAQAHRCIASGICARCGKAQDCVLPQAMSYRAAQSAKDAK